LSETVRPRLSFLAPEDAGRIIEEACRILETTGVLIEHEEGRRLLDKAGASTHEGRHRIPEEVVRSALSTCPRRIVLYDRNGDPAMDLGDDRVHFDPGSAAIHIYDAGLGARREATSRDVIDLIRLVDGLPHYAAQSTALTPSDVPSEIADRYRLYLALRHGGKPVVTGTFRKDGFVPMRAMLAAVRGGEDALWSRPLAIFDCCPSPPLKWSDLTCDALLGCARAGIPAELVSMPLAGATSPVTLRSAVVQHCAESLSGIAIHQLARPGAPIIYGGAPAAFDMRHGTTPMGAIETMMIASAYAQVGKHLGLPTHGYLALSDAKTPDYQAGLESGIGAVLAALAGINVVSGPGMLDYLLTQSTEKLLLDHEACGMALRLIRGIEAREENAGELIDALVRAGEFLSHPHTRRFWRKELSIPSSLIDRDTYGDWKARGGKTALERAREEAARRLAPADAGAQIAPQAQLLDEIMLGEAARHGLGALPGR
jgi:trimethylamine---corrinoid protein Co-methyltransferase